MNDAINADRTGFLGGSDAKRIINNDWLSLYDEKVGNTQPEDLSGVFRVQLGKHTEPFHREWLRSQMNLPIYPTDTPQLSHPDHPFLRAQIDTMIVGSIEVETPTFIELKHSNERANPRDTAEYYMPQLAHYCNVLGVDTCYMSVIPGNGEPFLTRVQVPVDYTAALLEQELAFWWHVVNLRPPDASLITGKYHGAAFDAGAAIINNYRKVDMTGSNQWASACLDYLACKDAASTFEASKKLLKGLVEDDVSEASGHGVTIKRSKSGSLLFSTS